MQIETWPSYEGAGGACRGYLRCGRGQGGGGPGRGRGQVILYNCIVQGHYAWECTSQNCPYYQYCTQFDHMIEEFPILIAKMRVKKAQPKQLIHNLQMMRAKHHEEDPNVNIVLLRRMMTSDDKGK